MSSLHHEHLIRINDPANVLGRWLTRAELWEGLRHTILAPQSIDSSIDAVTLKEIDASCVEREIRRGQAALCDRVTLTKHHRLVVHADPTGMFAGSTLTIEIEEPVPEMLFVRFTYDLRGLEGERTDEEDRARRSAYEQSDIERVRQARHFLDAIGTAH